MKIISYTLILFLCFSCHDKIVCPAYQSAFILDDKTREAYFSYLWLIDEVSRDRYLVNSQSIDTVNILQTEYTNLTTMEYLTYVGDNVIPRSMPKKNKNGIVKSEFYPVKNYQMKIAPKENILAPALPDNISDAIEGDYLLTEMIDSTFSDSSIVSSISSSTQDEATKYKYDYDPSDNFNVEQLYYNKYYDEFFLFDEKKVNLSVDSLTNQPNQVDTTKNSWFKKKRKRNQPSTTPSESNIDVNDSEIKNDSNPSDSDN